MSNLEPDNGPTEFGGFAITDAGVQPWPHEPTVSEALSLQYRTGDPSGLTSIAEDEGASFQGLLPLAQQTEIANTLGLLEKGEYDPRRA